VTSINLFIVVATLVVLFMGIIWSNKGWLNILIKMTMFGITFWGAYIIIVSRMFG